MNENHVFVIRNKDYPLYKKQINNMKDKDIHYAGVVVVKSIKQNNVTKKKEEYIIGLTY